MTEYVTHHGISLKIDPKIMSEKMISVIRSKTYEGAEAKQIDRIVEQGEVILEIGAGIGFISTLLAKNPFTTRVVSYEANPLLIPSIQDTVDRNIPHASAKWEIRNAVLKTGQAVGDADFYVHNDFWASSLAPFANPARVEKVPFENFNKVVADLAPTMIVCDIEGGELDLFRNADLSGVMKIYVEVHQNRLGRKGMKSLFEIFHSRDFHYDEHHSSGSVVLFSHVDRKKRS